MKQELIALRHAMERAGVDWYLILTDDFHASEYVGSYFMCRKFVSGFTGSAGTLLVGRDWAGLWTDGRYFLQASQQLAGSGIELCRMGEPGVPALTAFLGQNLAAGQTLGFDGRTVSSGFCRELMTLAERSGAKVSGRLDLVDEIWTDRPRMSAEPVYELALSQTGRTRAEKLAALRADVQKAGADSFVLASLADIAWLLNLRGGDVACTPVFLSFFAMTPAESVLFVNPAILSDAIRAGLEADGVKVLGYNDIYDYVNRLEPGSRLLMDLSCVNSAIEQSVPQGVVIVNGKNPTELPKAAKNPTEVENFRLAHQKDGVAVTRFIYWLKQNIGKVPMTEQSVSRVLEGFRQEQADYVGPSFSPIMAYGAHGAIVHYSATEESDAVLEPRSFLLADTGGHYLQGTTDITRTIVLGELTEEERRCYTLVLKGHLRLGAARFREGTSGMNLDVLARQPLWDAGMDYNHGTGHGVGYLLGVHEGPQNIRWKTATGTSCDLLPGMVTSNEPGVYLEGKFGVRLENLVTVERDETTAFGGFLRFQNLTMVPFDRAAIVPELLTDAERETLNRYHAEVLASIGAFLPEQERLWLEDATAAI